MFFDHGESHYLYHPRLQRDGKQPRIPSPITVHSIRPLFSSSPLLRAIVAPSVKPQSNSNASMAAHTNNNKPFLSNQEAPTSVQGLGFPLSNERAKASGPFQWLRHDANDTSNIKGYEDHMSVKLQIIRLCNEPSTNTNTIKRRHEVLRSLIYNFKNRKAMWHWLFNSFLACYTDGKVVMGDVFFTEINGWVNWYLVGKFVKKDFHALALFDEMSKRERANVHMLSIMSYHMVKSIPYWHIFHDERKLEVMTCKALSDRYINLAALRITGGAPVIVTLSSQDGTLLSFIGIVSLKEWDAFNEVFRNCSSLLAMGATIKVLKLMGLLLTNNGIVGSDRVVQAACAIVDAIETEVCELTLLNQKAAMVLQKLLSAAFSINSSSQFCSDIRRKLANDFMISLQYVVREGGELQPIRPLPWYPENHTDFSMLFTSNLDFQLIWDPGDASAKPLKLMLYLQCKDGKRIGTKQSCFCSRQCGGDWHHEAMPSLVSWVIVRWVRTWKPSHAYQYKLQNDKREKHMDNLFGIQRLLHLLAVSRYIRVALLYKIERNKRNTSVEQLGCLAIQLRCSDFNMEINNELNWSKEHNGVDIIVAMFLIVGTNVYIVQESSIPQHIADLARYMRMTMVSSVPTFPVSTGKSYNATKIAMKEMDIISTKLFLASESMCPALRWRSSQPDKHYKKLLVSKSPDGPSNERKIVTLCKYTAKSSFQILKIAKSLEDRSYKELKLEHNKFINMVVQMACFAVNLVNVVTELLNSSKQETIRMLGCQTLMTFIYSQTYGNYTHTIESSIHKVNKLARQSGGDHQGSRSSSLQCLSVMVPFLAEFSYILVDFDEIVHASLDNYEPNTYNEDDVKVTQLDGTKLSYAAKHTLISTGSRVQRLAISSQELGISSVEALSWEELPKHVVALREGYIVVEWRKMGASVNIFSRKELPLRGLNDEIRAVVALELKTSPFTRVVLQVQLQDSLDRDAKTLMVVHVSSEEDSFSETICTLQIAWRVYMFELGAARLRRMLLVQTSLSFLSLEDKANFQRGKYCYDPNYY